MGYESNFAKLRALAYNSSLTSTGAEGATYAKGAHHCRVCRARLCGAGAGLQDVRWHYYYPQSQWGEECAYCDDSDCGWITCVIEQGSDPNDGDNCAMDGAGCDDKGSGYCPPPSYSRLDTNWRLTHVQVVTRTAQRPASVRFGKKG
jgi:hypothetical protein